MPTDDMVEQPFYPLVSVLVKNVPKCLTWKVWRAASGALRWELLSFSEALFPDVNMKAANFRVGKAFQRGVRAWFDRVPIEGKLACDLWHPSLREVLAEGGHPSSNLHKTASLSNYGFLSVLLWCASMRQVGQGRDAGLACVRGFLYSRLPALSDADIGFGAAFAARKSACVTQQDQGVCIHLCNLYGTWVNGASYIANITKLLARASAYAHDCQCCRQVYPIILSKLDSLIVASFDAQVAKSYISYIYNRADTLRTNSIRTAFS
jgi:hypothetical protein